MSFVSVLFIFSELHFSVYLSLLWCIQIKLIVKIIVSFVPFGEFDSLLFYILFLLLLLFFASEEDALVHPVRSRAEEVCRTRQSSAVTVIAATHRCLLLQTLVRSSVEHERLHREDPRESVNGLGIFGRAHF